MERGTGDGGLEEGSKEGKISERRKELIKRKEGKEGYRTRKKRLDEGIGGGEKKKSIEGRNEKE